MAERWFDRCLIKTPFSSLPINWAADLKRLGFLPPAGFSQIEKTEFERQAIKAAVEALNFVLVDLQLPPVEFSEQRFYFLDAKAYQTMFGDDDIGRYKYGRAFIKRRTDQVSLVCTLTHELAHFVSYNSVVINHSRKGNEDLLKYTWYYRSGLGFLPEPEKAKKVYFWGLNEAVTEMLAVEIRRALIKNSALFKGVEAERLTSEVHSYNSVVKLVLELISLVGHSPENKSNLRRELFKNFITGRYTFLKKLEKYHRGR